MSTATAFFNRLDNDRTVGLCLCWEINRTDGVSLYFTNHDRTLTASYDSVEKTFTPTATFSGSAAKGTEGLAVDNMNIVGLTSDDITEEDLLAGKYEDAEVIVYLAQWDNAGVGLHILKRGWMGDIRSRGNQFETEVRGVAYRLQQQLGRVYTLECNAQLGDSRCGVDLDSYFNAASAVASVTDAREFTINLTGEASDYFQYGVLRFTSGDNDGRSIEVLGHKVSGGVETITLLEKAPYAVEVGDTVFLTAGCDKSVTQCKTKFGNFLNYRGFHLMPTETEAFQTPNAK